MSLVDKNSSKTTTKAKETCLEALDQEWEVKIVHTDARVWWMCLDDKYSLATINESMRDTIGGNRSRVGTKDSAHTKEYD